MAAKATPKAKKPLAPSQRDLTAKICGCLAGTSDHIGRMQQEIVDIAGRCELATKYAETIPREVVSETDLKFFAELKEFCETRFGNLHDMRRKIEAVLVKTNAYKPGAND